MDYGLLLNVQPMMVSSTVDMLFSNQKIFLDMKDYKEIDQLEANIRQFGGIIEKFLSKDITCIVTHRTRTESLSLQKDVSLPVSTHRQLFQLPSGGQVMSRGLSLLSRSYSLRHISVCDLVAFAEMWGIKIVTLDAVMQAINTQLQLCNQPSPVAKRCSKSHRIINQKKLVGAFVKVEDTESNFRPLFSQYLSFPYLSLEGDLSNGIFKRAEDVQPVVIGKNLSTAAGTRNQKAWSRQGYCECCDTVYEDMNQHLTGADHRRFAENVENFANLDKVIDLICSAGGTDMLLPAKYVASKTQNTRSMECSEEMKPGSYNDVSASAVECASDHSGCLREKQSSGQCDVAEQCILHRKVKILIVGLSFLNPGFMCLP